MYKRQGLKEKELAQVYRTCLLPVLDYCNVVYHSLLTDEQDQRIERLQAAALRSIYGHEVPYSKMRQLAEVTTLRQRRLEACDKFAKKNITGKFSRWFPYRPIGRPGNRGGELFLEERARCNRLRDSPIFYMRRRLNGKEGKSYGERNREYRDEGGRISETMNAARKKKTKN